MLVLWSQKKETIIFRAKKLLFFFRAKKFFFERQQNGVVFQLSVDLTGLRGEHKNTKNKQKKNSDSKNIRLTKDFSSFTGPKRKRRFRSVFQTKRKRDLSIFDFVVDWNQRFFDCRFGSRFLRTKNASFYTFWISPRFKRKPKDLYNPLLSRRFFLSFLFASPWWWLQSCERGIRSYWKWIGVSIANSAIIPLPREDFDSFAENINEANDDWEDEHVPLAKEGKLKIAL